MFKIFHHKSGIDKILGKRKNYTNWNAFLISLSDQELHKLGKKIIWNEHDGYNTYSCENNMLYFNDLNRRQKEFYVEERIYAL